MPNERRVLLFAEERRCAGLGGTGNYLDGCRSKEAAFDFVLQPLVMHFFRVRG